jgi:hypothetical protein
MSVVQEADAVPARVSRNPEKQGVSPRSQNPAPKVILSKTVEVRVVD